MDARTARPVAVVAAALFVVLALAAALRTSLWTYGADTGTFVQAILDTFGGMRTGLEGGTHFRYHDSPALALLWPLLAATHSVLALQLVQVLATLACGPLLYALVRPYLSATLAVRAGILALLYPPLLALAFNEFHEVGVLAPLALGLFLAADRRAWVWFAVCTVLMVALREDVCIEVAIVGCIFAVTGTPAGRSRALSVAGMLAASAALTSLGIYYGIVVPRLGGWAPSHFYVYPFAGGPLQLLLAPFVAPLQFVPAVATVGRLTYLLEAFVPLAFLPLRSRWSWTALPGFAIVLLANTGLVWRMGMHYSALWIPWLLAGAAFGVRTIANGAGERAASRWLNVALALSAIVLVAFNPAHPAHYLRADYHDLAAARAALACVPPAESLATHDEWYSANAAYRPRATVARTDGVDYLVYADDFDNAEFRREILPRLRDDVATGAYRIVCSFGAVHTYERAGVQTTPPGAFPTER